MLVLTRKPGEKICIDQNIIVSVIEIQGNQVRIGIEAPKEVMILREEVYREVKNINLQAICVKHIPDTLLKNLINDKKS